MQPTRRLLAVLLLACSAVVALGAPSSAACAVRPASVQQHAAGADDVFSGAIADRSLSGDTVSYTVAVDRVYQGTVSTQKISVTTDARPRSCGQPDLRRGRSYVFFTQERSRQLVTSRRSGTAPATDGYVARVEKVLGEGRPVVSPTPEPAEVKFTTVAADPADLQRMAAPGVALLIVGLLGLVVASWRARRA